MLSIDHVVIAAQNPEQSAHAFGKTHGVTVVEGGRHDAWGTYNMLAYFKNDCYLEWLGVFDQQKAEQGRSTAYITTIAPWLLPENVRRIRPTQTNLIKERRLELLANKNEDQNPFIDSHPAKAPEQELRRDNGPII